MALFLKRSPWATAANIKKDRGAILPCRQMGLCSQCMGRACSRAALALAIPGLQARRESGVAGCIKKLDQPDCFFKKVGV